MEIVEFVLNRTGVEKYQELARWMGFEPELHFQEKLAKIISQLEKQKQQIEMIRDDTLRMTEQLIENNIIDDTTILAYCNGLLKNINIPPVHSTVSGLTSKKDLENYLPNIARLQIQAPLAKNLNVLSSAEISLTTFSTNKNIAEQLVSLKKDAQKFVSEQKSVRDIGAIDLYNKAQEIIGDIEEEQTQCPVCGTRWERKKLIEHIKKELNLLDQIKLRRTELLEEAEKLKSAVRNERGVVIQTISKYQEVKAVIPSLNYEIIEKYKTILNELEFALANDFFVESGKPNFVLMSITEYGNIFDKEKKREEELKTISKEELIEKMNREIASWREAQREKEIEEIDEIVKKEDVPKDEESYYYDIENKLDL